jgi:putative transposon-encoded protein
MDETYEEELSCMSKKITIIGNEGKAKATKEYIAIRGGFIFISLAAYRAIGSPTFVQIGSRGDEMDIFGCEELDVSARKVKSAKTYAFIYQTGPLASYIANKLGTSPGKSFRINCERKTINGKPSIGFRL